MTTADKADIFRTAYDIGLQGAAARLAPDGSMVITVPRDTRDVILPPIDPTLTVTKQSVLVHDADSFIDYVNRFKTDQTRIFSEPGFLSGSAGGGSAHVTAVIDYHDVAGPRYCNHAIVYRPRYSTQWTTWQKLSGTTLKQAEFAEIIEENRADITEPMAATLLDIARTFKASRKVEFDSLTYQPNGDAMLTYDDRTQQTGKSGPIPEKMQLGIPVYFRGTVYAVPMFIRFKVSTGAVGFTLKLDRADVIEDEAFGEITEKVQTATGITVWLGRRA